ncbi:DUF4091 domain-containing protein [Kribbella sp. VKM Ac-2566]|uniref:DUF4091 domain-containing protein n=1 Tax=Kribbella sp. VKM Ac-2566 TaxID=2512218 RepID=UPI0010E543E0|nr:DUF4091 domain-containing protein [Kribbella sp. VKM Ac-2566]TDW92288.1 uncharacterized protein DUF4091 [Kribbella sp. VKM Ac-2566]
MTAQWEFVLCDALAKVHPVRDPRPVSAETRFQAFLGERASFQLAYRPPLEPTFRDPRPLQVRVDGTAADLVAMSSVDLVPCTFVALPGHDDGYEFDEPGLYPDVLRPVPNGEAPVRFGSWSALWFDVMTTDPARAGVHELTVVVSAPDGSELHRAPVAVEITGIELPPLDIVSGHWMHLDSLADHYGVEVFSEEHWAIVERFMASAVEMGATSLLAPVWTPPLDTAVGTYRTVVQLIDITATNDGYEFGFDRLRRWLDVCRRTGITGVEVAHLFTQWGAKATPGIVVGEERVFGWDVPATDVRYRELMEALLPALQAVLDEEWDREYVVFHISDEPSGEDGLASYLAAKAVVADLLKGWTVVDALSEHSFYTSGAVEVPVVATDHVEPFLAERPERMWVYYCVSQDRDVANRFIGMPSARNRAIGHQLFASGVDGFLHWGFNFWYTWHSIRRVDPFADTSAGGAFPSGDPFAVYPGPDGTPWPSLRHRVFAQAMWDHRALQAVRAAHGNAAALDLIDPDRTLRFDRPVLDPNHYYEARRRITNALTTGSRV